jgi:hypothetical protein
MLFRKSVDFQLATRFHIPQDNTLHFECLTPRGMPILAKLIVSGLINTFSAFMEPKDSLVTNATYWALC